QTGLPRDHRTATAALPARPPRRAARRRGTRTPPGLRPPARPGPSASAQRGPKEPVMTITRPIRVAVIGAGVRGTSHSRHIRRHGGQITAIAEPDELRRRRLAAEHGVPQEACFADWRELARRGAERCDAVLIAT